MTFTPSDPTLQAFLEENGFRWLTADLEGRKLGMIVKPPDRSADPKAPRASGTLSEGYSRLRLAKGGPWVAAELCYGPPSDPETGEPLDRSWCWQVFLNGDEYDGPNLDVSAMVWRVHTSRPISKADHDHLVKVARWCRENAPGLPEANPYRPVNLGQMNSLF